MNNRKFDVTAIGNAIVDVLAKADDALLELIREIWLGRTDRYSEQRAALRAAAGDRRKIEMHYIGG